MMEFLGYLWLRPWWLLLVPLAMCLAIWMTRRLGGLGAWERAVDPVLLAALDRFGRVIQGNRTPAMLPGAVLAVLGIALASPSTERRDLNSYRNLDGVVLVLDLSPSMTGNQAFFDTLTAARLIADAAGTRQVSLVVYAGEAFVAAPFSTDARALAGTISLLDDETMPVAGSRPEEGLALAGQLLIDARMLAADVVLISDGGGVGPEAVAEARALSDAGWRVSTIAVGQAADRDVIAQVGAGESATVHTPFSVARRIAAHPIDHLVENGFSMLVLEDQGRWLLLLALIPAFLMLPRRGRA